MDRSSRAYADELIENEFLQIFYSDKIPSNFIFDENSFLYCYSLAQKYNRKELSGQLIKYYPDKKGFNYLLNAMRYYEDLNNDALMLDAIKQFNNLYPERSEGLEMLAKYHIERNETEEVFQISLKIFKLDGLNPDNNLRLSNFYFEKNKIDSAYIFCSIAKTINPNVSCKFAALPPPEPCCYFSDFAVPNEFDGKESKKHIVSDKEYLNNILAKRKSQFPSLSLEIICERNGILKDMPIYPGQIIYLHVGCDIQFYEFSDLTGIDSAVKVLAKSEIFKGKSEPEVLSELLKYNLGTNHSYMYSIKKKKWFYKSLCKVAK
ncbi:MAG: hypothetical protein H6565_12060 [Lewinellaceae bacterium]|nr:hypothetical protein [Lewinellaceae bacterium]MCB9355205.1 hypothetical protein [Lewinellaceae bacterium]